MGRRAEMTNSTFEAAEIHALVGAAARRLESRVRRTFLEPSAWLGQASGSDVRLKLEHLQITGSFKLRGAFNKILTLSEDEAQAGVVTASSGNHGMATAYALKACGKRGAIYLPETVAKTKLDALRRLGADPRLVGLESGDAELAARQAAEREGKVYVSPYNDPQVIAGQGTLGVELLADWPDLEAVFVSVGGGGLISGIGSFLKTERPAIRIIGCLPENSPVMYESVRAGRIVQCPNLPTLSDGTAGSVEEGSITFDLCRQVVDEFILVSEEEIALAMRRLIVEQRMVVEGSAAVAVAALLKSGRRFSGKKTAIVLCGGNVDAEIVKRVFCGNAPGGEP